MIKYNEMDRKWEEIKPQYVRDLLKEIDDLESEKRTLRVELNQRNRDLTRAKTKINELLEDIKKLNKAFKEERRQHYSAISIYALLRDELEKTK